MRYNTMADLQRAISESDVTLVTDGYRTDVVPRVAVKVVQAGVQRITLDYPPSANRYWRVYNNRVVRSSEATDYVGHVAQVCQTAGIKPINGDVAVTLRVYRPQRSGDLDNRLKCCLDALQGYAYHNDSQIVAIHATRHDDKDCPRIELEIEEL